MEGKYFPQKYMKGIDGLFRPRSWRIFILTPVLKFQGKPVFVMFVINYTYLTSHVWNSIYIF